MAGFNVTTYVAGNSSVHRLDARSKIILLIIYSACLFFIDTWPGMAIAAVLFVIVYLASGLPAGNVFGMVKPIYVIVAIVVICNMFLYQYGQFQFAIAGLNRGLFFGVRILLLVWICLVVCLTSTSTQLVGALNSFLRPLCRFHVPTDDIAMVFIIALRFIPLIAEEFIKVKNAQLIRGAKLEAGGAVARVKAYSGILIPMFVGLFRRADSLALALDSRCYGMPNVSRTSISARRMSVTSIVVALVGTVVFVGIAIFM